MNRVKVDVRKTFVFDVTYYQLLEALHLRLEVLLDGSLKCAHVDDVVNDTVRKHLTRLLDAQKRRHFGFQNHALHVFGEVAVGKFSIVIVSQFTRYAVTS